MTASLKQDLHSLWVAAGALGALEREFERHLDSGATSSNTDSADDISIASSSANSRRSGCQQGGHSRTGYTNLPTSPVLELVLGGKPVAVAVRKHGGLPRTQACTPSSHAGQEHTEDQHARQPYRSPTGSTESASPSGKEKEPWTCIYGMDGTVLAAEQGGYLHKDGLAGAHTHTVLTGQTPLVRHLHVVSIAGGNPANHDIYLLYVCII